MTEGAWQNFGRRGRRGNGRAAFFCLMLLVPKNLSLVPLLLLLMLFLLAGKLSCCIAFGRQHLNWNS